MPLLTFHTAVGVQRSLGERYVLSPPQNSPPADWAPAVTLAAQAEPSASGEYVDLVQQLEQSVSARYKTEHDLRVYRRKVEAELEEKARWGELLRRHGLLA